MAGKQFRNLHSLASISRRSYCPGKNKSGKLMSISSKILIPYWKHRFILISHFENMTNFTCSLVFTELFSYTQEEFRAKQANIFAALDKLYILHNAILAESRFIKAFFFYSCIVFLVYMLTSAKQTFGIRGQLYFGMISLQKLKNLSSIKSVCPFG
jgi:hypothetical protein